MFARAGAEVIASARREHRLKELAAEVAGIRIYPADASDPAAMNALAEFAGPIDTLVYATGTNTPDRLLPLSHAQRSWDIKMIGVNLSGA